MILDELATIDLGPRSVALAWLGQASFALRLAGTTLLLVAGWPDPLGAAALLAVFASGTPISMALVSAGFGWAARTGRASRWFERAIPVFGCGSLAFGVWYVLAAILSPGA